MRTLIFSFFFILILQSCMSQTSNFRLSLKIIQKERSKDSNSTIESFTIKDNLLQYNIAYQGGGNPPPNSKKQVKLSNGDIQKIQSLIEDKKLYQNILAPKRSEFKSPYSATEISFITNKKKASYQIQLYDLSNKIVEEEMYQRIIDVKILLKSHLN